MVTCPSHPSTRHVMCVSSFSLSLSCHKAWHVTAIFDVQHFVSIVPLIHLILSSIVTKYTHTRTHQQLLLTIWGSVSLCFHLLCNHTNMFSLDTMHDALLMFVTSISKKPPENENSNEIQSTGGLTSSLTVDPKLFNFFYCAQWMDCFSCRRHENCSNSMANMSYKLTRCPVFRAQSG